VRGLREAETARVREQGANMTEAGNRVKEFRATRQKRSLTPAEQDQALDNLRQACRAASLAQMSMRMLSWSLKSPECANHPERKDEPQIAAQVKEMTGVVETLCGPLDWLR